MRYLSAHIIIGRWTFKSVADVAIEESMATLIINKFLFKKLNLYAFTDKQKRL